MTLPVGVLTNWEITVAVRVTLCPVLADAGDACTVVVLAASTTPPVENTVMEYGGNEYGVAGLKLLTLLCVGPAMTGVSVNRPALLLVRFVEVNWLMTTLPLGALTPEKVTGRDPLRLRLKTTALFCVPLVKANDCK